MRTLLHPFALAALVTLSVTGGAAYAQTATVSQEHGLDYRPPGDLWQTAGQAQERDRSVLGSAEPIPEPTPTPQPQVAPVGHRRGNAIVTAASLLLALGAQPIRWWLGRRSPGRRPISTTERRYGR